MTNNPELAPKKKPTGGFKSQTQILMDQLPLPKSLEEFNNTLEIFAKGRKHRHANEYWNQCVNAGEALSFAPNRISYRLFMKSNLSQGSFFTIKKAFEQLSQNFELEEYDWELLLKGALVTKNPAVVHKIFNSMTRLGYTVTYNHFDLLIKAYMLYGNPTEATQLLEDQLRVLDAQNPSHQKHVSYLHQLLAEYHVMRENTSEARAHIRMFSSLPHKFFTYNGINAIFHSLVRTGSWDKAHEFFGKMMYDTESSYYKLMETSPLLKSIVAERYLELVIERHGLEGGLSFLKSIEPKMSTNNLPPLYFTLSRAYILHQRPSFALDLIEEAFTRIPDFHRFDKMITLVLDLYLMNGDVSKAQLFLQDHRDFLSQYQMIHYACKIKCTVNGGGLDSAYAMIVHAVETNKERALPDNAFFHWLVSSFSSANQCDKALEVIEFKRKLGAQIFPRDYYPVFLAFRRLNQFENCEHLYKIMQLKHDPSPDSFIVSTTVICGTITNHTLEANEILNEYLENHELTPYLLDVSLRLIYTRRQDLDSSRYENVDARLLDQLDTLLAKAWNCMKVEQGMKRRREYARLLMNHYATTKSSAQIIDVFNHLLITRTPIDLLVLSCAMWGLAKSNRARSGWHLWVNRTKFMSKESCIVALSFPPIIHALMKIWVECEMYANVRKTWLLICERHKAHGKKGGIIRTQEADDMINMFTIGEYQKRSPKLASISPFEMEQPESLTRDEIQSTRIERNQHTLKEKHDSSPDVNTEQHLLQYFEKESETDPQFNFLLDPNAEYDALDPGSTTLASTRASQLHIEEHDTDMFFISGEEGEQLYRSSPSELQDSNDETLSFKGEGDIDHESYTDLYERDEADGSLIEDEELYYEEEDEHEEFIRFNKTNINQEKESNKFLDQSSETGRTALTTSIPNQKSGYSTHTQDSIRKQQRERYINTQSTGTFSGNPGRLVKSELEGKQLHSDTLFGEFDSLFNGEDEHKVSHSSEDQRSADQEIDASIQQVISTSRKHQDEVIKHNSEYPSPEEEQESGNRFYISIPGKKRLRSGANEKDLFDSPYWTPNAPLELINYPQSIPHWDAVPISTGTMDLVARMATMTRDFGLLEFINRLRHSIGFAPNRHSEFQNLMSLLAHRKMGKFRTRVEEYESKYGKMNERETRKLMTAFPYFQSARHTSIALSYFFKLWPRAMNSRAVIEIILRSPSHHSLFVLERCALQGIRVTPSMITNIVRKIIHANSPIYGAQDAIWACKAIFTHDQVAPSLKAIGLIGLILSASKSKHISLNALFKEYLILSMHAIDKSKGDEASNYAFAIRLINKIAIRAAEIGQVDFDPIPPPNRGGFASQSQFLLEWSHGIRNLLRILNEKENFKVYPAGFIVDSGLISRISNSLPQFDEDRARKLLRSLSLKVLCPKVLLPPNWFIHSASFNRAVLQAAFKEMSWQERNMWDDSGKQLILSREDDYQDMEEIDSEIHRPNLEIDPVETKFRFHLPNELPHLQSKQSHRKLKKEAML